MPQAVAARTELRSLKMLHLNPDVLRQYCSVKAPYTLASDGSNLPAVLARMQKEDKYVLGDISRDMVNLVPGIHKIRVEKNKLSDQYIIQARTSDQRSFSSQVLSDGTLRLLAMIDSLLFALKIAHVEPGKGSLHVTRMVPVFTTEAPLEQEEDVAAETYTINQVKKYLDSGSFDKARRKLTGRRAISHERNFMSPWPWM